MEYKKTIKINPDKLEDEWMEQPANYLDAWELYADAVEIRDKKKARMEIVHSELDEKIRKYWKKYGFEVKPTEPLIKEWIRRNKKYIKAERKLISANHQVNLTNGIKKSFEHKKDALGNIVTMKVSGYYSSPSTYDQKEERKSKRLEERKRKKLIEKKKKYLKELNAQTKK